jgi:hypothetical protein
MFRVATHFDVYPLGYEHTMPILREFRDHPEVGHHKAVIERILDNFNNTPDFLLVKPDKSEIFLIEVKFRHEFSKNNILEIANDIRTRWNPVYIFLATPEGFYFDTCNEILNKEGEITPLSETWIPKHYQQTYLNLLNKFER